jgi:hypothetical protein
MKPLRLVAFLATTALAFSGCRYTAGENYLPGENFGKGGARCGTVNTFSPVKRWGCLVKK